MMQVTAMSCLSSPSNSHTPRGTILLGIPSTPTFKASAPLPFLHTFSKPSSKQLPSNAVVCMANPRRVKMVAQQIKREVADMLLQDKVLRAAVLPETALGADMYLSSVTTVSDVEVSGDLQVVKVYISVFGDERGQEIAIRGLQAKEKYVRMQLGRRVRLRLTPEVRFIHDDSLERGSKVIAILDKLKAKREQQEKGEIGNSMGIREDITEEEEEEEDQMVDGPAQ
ncbi:hypothetical protein O6H91_20G061800 [Diphasiastrum complanatum]|uniref:Uncharacterized protein n=1 Tax=Diphasiastrum complanatum TaxID=34168 RepID=A0ACC2AR60_DIPCM|nr:hypothetical protein O6H91_20G061800 [Diphasiastrum complanatum]